MTRNKKPVVIVAILLAALIFVPLLLLWVTRMGGNAPSGDRSGVSDSVQVKTEVADFDLRQLASKAESLLEQELADALRDGDVSLELMSELKHDADEAEEAMHKGKLDRAGEYYRRVIEVGEQRLEALALADRARALSDETYAELQGLEYLKAALKNAYGEATERYNTAQRALNAGDYQAAVDDFEMANAILGDMEARAIQQTAGLLETAEEALENYELDKARAAYESVLELDADNAEATEGLSMVGALEDIAAEVKEIRALEEQGAFEDALEQLEALALEHPENPFIEQQRAHLKERMLERDYQALLADSVAAEKANDFATAISALEDALELKSSGVQQARLKELKETHKAARLEEFLSDGYDALSGGRYQVARDIYKKAVALASDSKEARTGLEKASSLYLANIRYSQNIAATDKYIEEGRFPLAAKLFNEAMDSRPSKVSTRLQSKENRLRATLKAQAEEVTVTLKSDKRTYVSIIGVFPPDRFKQKELNLFPDVYKVRGTRSGYETVEIELKVDATQANPSLTVECSEKQ